MVSLNSALMAVYFLTAFSQLSRKRFTFVFLSGLLFVSHDIISDHLSDPVYYFSAAIVDASCIVIAFLLSPIDKAIRRLQVCCFYSILINTYGFIIWYLYFQPATYNYLCTINYLFMISISLTYEDRALRPDHSDSVIQLHHCGGALVSKKNGGRRK